MRLLCDNKESEESAQIKLRKKRKKSTQIYHYGVKLSGAKSSS